MSDIPVIKKARNLCKDANCRHPLYRHYFGGMCLASYECKCVEYQR